MALKGYPAGWLPGPRLQIYVMEYLLLTQVICLPDQDWGSWANPTHQPAWVVRTFSLSSLTSGLAVPGVGDPSIMPWLGFVQLSVLDSFSSCQADPTSHFACP